MVKCVLIRPRYLSVWESLACGYIASYLKRYYKGDLELQFFDGFFDTDEEIIKGSVDSDYVGFSCTSPQMKHALALAEEIKRQNLKVKTVFGGHHPSSLPEETKAYPQVDIVVTGEGETGMLMALQKKRTTCAYLPIENLDTIPFPDRRLIRQERTIAITEKNDGERIASVLSSRGCFFNCVFCTGDHDVFPGAPRRRSVGNVLDEIEGLVKEWRIDFLKFSDVELNTSKQWLQDFCREKVARHITVPFGCNIHAALIDKWTLEMMKDANCREVWIGIESGSPRILAEMGKSITVPMVENVFRWAKEVGILRRAYFMCGFSSERREDFDMSLELAERLDADRYGLTILAPYPGTQVYSDYKDALGLERVDWSSVDEYSNNVWGTPAFSNQQLKDLQKEFTEKFRDRLVWRQKKC